MTKIPSTVTETEALWQKVCDQDPETYERLQDLIKTVCTPLLRQGGVPASEQKELLDETLVSVWEYARRQSDRPRNFQGFLKWRARAVSRKYVRRKLAQRVVVNLAATLEPADADAHPGDLLSLSDLKRTLKACLEELDEKYRRIWVDRYESGMSVHETAEAQGIPKTTVAVRLHRARQKLQECLRRKGLLP